MPTSLSTSHTLQIFIQSCLSFKRTGAWGKSWSRQIYVFDLNLPTKHLTNHRPNISSILSTQTKFTRKLSNIQNITYLVSWQVIPCRMLSAFARGANLFSQQPLAFVEHEMPCITSVTLHHPKLFMVLVSVQWKFRIFKAGFFLLQYSKSRLNAVRWWHAARQDAAMQYKYTLCRQVIISAKMTVWLRIIPKKH